MPNRIIREGFLDSESIDGLTPQSENLYHRLLLGADDAGRLDGRTKFIASRLYPLRYGSLRASDVEKWLSECLQAGLIALYERNGNQYLQLTKWQRCGKAETSKYPDRNGSYKIDYVSRETRDGVKDFVTSSLIDVTPCAPHADHIGTPCAPHADGVTPNSNTNTETDTIFEDGGVATAQTQKSSEPKAAERIKFSETEGWTGITETDLNDWRAAYPACDIGMQLNQAAVWAKSNPKKRKGNWCRFLTNWLSRAQERGGR